MTADTVGGVWTYALELARGLTDHGVEVTMATMGQLPSDQQRAEAAAIPHLSLRTSVFKLEWMPDCWDSVHKSASWLLHLYDEVQPDLVHLNGYCHGSLPWTVPTLTVAHSCVVSWWEAVKGSPPPADWDVYRQRVAEGLAGVDCVVAPTRWMAAAIARIYGVAGVATIANGVEQRMFVPAEQKDPFVFAAGRIWDEAKNLSTLDRACADLAWPLFLAGETSGPSSEQVQPVSALLLGRLPPHEVAAWMGTAAVYALPARYEPFGLSALEAALCECALVLGDIPTLRETWDGAALFVDPDDERAIREAIDRFMRSPDLRMEFGCRARERAMAFSRDRMTAGYMSVYQRLLEGVSTCESSSSAIPYAPTGITATPTSSAG
jgi:glycogen(starch) synthase